MIIEHAQDITLGLGGATAPWWVPALYEVNIVFGTIATIGGAILVICRLYILLEDRRRNRRSGDAKKL